MAKSYIEDVANAMATITDINRGEDSVGGTQYMKGASTVPTWTADVEKARNKNMAPITSETIIRRNSAVDASTVSSNITKPTEPSIVTGATPPKNSLQSAADMARETFNHFSDTPVVQSQSRFDMPVKNENVTQSRFGKEAEDVINMIDAGAIDFVNTSKNLPQNILSGNAGLKAYSAKTKSDAVSETYLTMIEEASKYPKGYVYNGHTKEEWQKLLDDYSKSEYKKQSEIATKYADKAREVGVWSESAKKNSDAIKEAIMDDGETAKWFGDLAYSAGQQLPSMATGALTAGVGTVLGLGTGAVQTAQAVASLGTMYSNVYNNTFNNLYSTGQYSVADISEKATMDAMLEVGTELLVGGTPGLGTGLLDSAEGVIYSKIAEPLAKKFAGQAVKATGAAALAAKAATYLASDGFKFFYDVAGEGVEEMVSEALSPYIDRMTVDPDAESASAKDIALAFAGGAITSAFFNVTASITNMANSQGRVLISDANGVTNVKAVSEITQDDIDQVKSNAREASSTARTIRRGVKVAEDYDTPEMLSRRTSLRGMTNKELRKIISELYSEGYISKDIDTSKMGKEKLVQTILESEGLRDSRTAEPGETANQDDAVSDVDVTSAVAGLTNSQLRDVLLRIGINTNKLRKASRRKLLGVILTADKTKVVKAIEDYKATLPVRSGEPLSGETTVESSVDTTEEETVPKTELDIKAEYNRLKGLMTVIDIRVIRRIAEGFANKGYISLPKDLNKIGNKFTLIDIVLNHGNGLPDEAVKHIEMMSDISSYLVKNIGDDSTKPTVTETDADETSVNTVPEEPDDTVLVDDSTTQTTVDDDGIFTIDEIDDEDADIDIDIEDPNVGYKVNAVNLYVAAMNFIAGRGATREQAEALGAAELAGKSLAPQFYPDNIPELTDRLTVDEITEWFNSEVIPRFKMQEDWIKNNYRLPDLDTEHDDGSILNLYKSVSIMDENGKLKSYITKRDYRDHFLKDVLGLSSDDINNRGAEYWDIADKSFEELANRQKKNQDDFVNGLKDRLSKIGVTLRVAGTEYVNRGASGQTGIESISSVSSGILKNFYEKAVTGKLTRSDLASLGHKEAFVDEFMSMYNQTDAVDDDTKVIRFTPIIKNVIATNLDLIDDNFVDRAAIRDLVATAISSPNPLSPDLVSAYFDNGYSYDFRKRLASAINTYVENNNLKNEKGHISQEQLETSVKVVIASVGSLNYSSDSVYKYVSNYIRDGEKKTDSIKISDLEELFGDIGITKEIADEINRIGMSEVLLSPVQVTSIATRAAESSYGGDRFITTRAEVTLSRVWNALRSSMNSTLAHELMHAALMLSAEDRYRFEEILTKAMEATGKTREDFTPSISKTYGGKAGEMKIREETDASFIQTVISDPETIIQIAESGNPLISGFISYIVNAVKLEGVENLMTKEEIRIAKELRANEKRGKANARRKAVGRDPIVAPVVDITAVNPEGTNDPPITVTVVVDTAEEKKKGNHKDSDIVKSKKPIKKIKLDQSLVQYPVGNSGKLVKILTQDSFGNDIIAFKFHGNISGEQLAWLNSRGIKLDNSFVQSRWDKIYTAPFSQKLWDATGNEPNDTLETLKAANVKSSATDKTFSKKKTESNESPKVEDKSAEKKGPNESPKTKDKPTTKKTESKAEFIKRVIGSLIQYDTNSGGPVKKAYRNGEIWFIRSGNKALDGGFDGTDKTADWLKMNGAVLDTNLSNKTQRVYVAKFSQELWDATDPEGIPHLKEGELKSDSKKSEDTGSIFVPPMSIDDYASIKDIDYEDASKSPDEQTYTSEEETETTIDPTDIIPGVLKADDEIVVYGYDEYGKEICVKYPAKLYSDFKSDADKQKKKIRGGGKIDKTELITLIEVDRTGDILYEEDNLDIDGEINELIEQFDVRDFSDVISAKELIEENPFVPLTDDMVDEVFVEKSKDEEEIRQWEQAKERGSYKNGTPKSVVRGKKVSRVLDNSAFTEGVSEQLSDERRKQIQRDISLSYTPVENTKYEKDANRFWSGKEYTTKNGSFNLSKAVNDFHISATDGTVSPEKLARGGVLLAMIREMSLSKTLTDSELQLADRLMTDFALMSVVSGRTLQYFRHLSKMTGDGRTYYVSQMIKQLQNELHQDTSLLRRNARNALDDYELPEGLDTLLRNPNDKDAIETTKFSNKEKVDRQRREKMLNPETSDAEKIEIIEEAIKDDIASHIPPTVGSRLSAWRVSAMLGNIRTNVRNIASNIVMLAAKDIRDVQTGLIEDIVGDTNRTRNTTLTGVPKEIKELASDQWEKNRKNVEVGGKFSFKADVLRRAKSFGDSIPGKAAEAYQKVSSGALELGDSVFLGVTFRSSFARYAAANAERWGTTKEKVHEFLSADTLESQERLNETIAHATKEAHRATYREANDLATWLNRQSRKSSLAGLLIEGVVPFKRTPINVLIQGVRYSPVGILNGIYELTAGRYSGKIGPERVVIDPYTQKVVATYEKTVSDAIDDLTAGMTGTMVAGLGYFLGMLGIFKAGPSGNDREEYYDQMLGNQKYSVTIGDTNITLDWLTPVAMLLFAGVEYAQRTRAEVENGVEDTFSYSINRVLSAIGSMADPFTNLSMLSGVTDALSSYSESASDKLGNVVSTAAANYASQFIPTLAGQIARTIDGSRRTTYANKDIDILGGQTTGKFINRVKAKVPGLASDNEAYVDQWGRQEQYSGNVLGADLGRAGVFINQAITPWYARQINKTEVDDRIVGLFESTGDTRVIPNTPASNYSFLDKTYYLKPSEYTKTKKTVGQLSYAAVESMFSSRFLNELNSEDQADVVSEIYKFANSVARYDYGKDNNLYADYNEKDIPSDPSEKLKNIEASGLSVGDYYLIKKILSNQNTKNDKRRVARDLGLTHKQKEVLGL